MVSVLIDVFVEERSRRCGRNWREYMGAHMDKQLLGLSVLAKRCGHTFDHVFSDQASLPLSCFIKSPSFPLPVFLLHSAI